jgi:hypothetical protein
MSLSASLFDSALSTKPSVIADLSIYNATKENVSQEFMIVVAIIKKTLSYNRWVDPDADIKKDLKASEKQFTTIIKKVIAAFKLDEKLEPEFEKLNTPAEFEALVIKHKSKK